MLAFTIAWRYIRAQEKAFSRLILRVSVIGLALGVMVLTVVISVMNGFDAELRARLLGSVAHIVIEQPDALGQSAELAAKDAAVRAAFPFYQGSGMVEHQGSVQPVSLIAVAPRHLNELAPIWDAVSDSQRTRFNQGAGILLGAPLAFRFGLLPGDEVGVVLPVARTGRLHAETFAFTLAGTFELGAEVDHTLAVVNLATLPPVLLASSGQYGLQLRLEDPMQAEATAARLRTRFEGLVPAERITTWRTRYGELFQAVQMEKIMMFLILVLVIAVAAFNIVSGQLMVVERKRSDIAILRTMGATAAMLRQVFLIQGLGVACIGILAGLGLGLLATVNINVLVGVIESVAGVGLLDGSYFVEIPVNIKWSDLLVITTAAGVICLLSALIPARRAALLNPVSGLH